MNGTGDAEAFLAELPRLGPADSFHFGCHPGMTCFNACCADLNINLMPYDVLRLQSGLRVSSRFFFGRHAHLTADPVTGFPQVILKMGEGGDRRCPFVGNDGCQVYADRPAPCRMYPLGRGAAVDDDGRVSEQFVLVQEDHCDGFSQPTSWTVPAWQASQGLGDYNRMNDRYLALLSRWARGGEILRKEMFGKVFLLLYRLDMLRQLIIQWRWLERLDGDAERREAILEDDTERLDFAYGKVAAMLFGGEKQA